MLNLFAHIKWNPLYEYLQFSFYVLFTPVIDSVSNDNVCSTNIQGLLTFKVCCLFHSRAQTWDCSSCLTWYGTACIPNPKSNLLLPYNGSVYHAVTYNLDVVLVEWLLLFYHNFVQILFVLSVLMDSDTLIEVFKNSQCMMQYKVSAQKAFFSY